MEVVWHHDELIRFDFGEILGQPQPRLFDDPFEALSFEEYQAALCHYGDEVSTCSRVVPAT